MPTEDHTKTLIWRANYKDGTSLIERDQNGHEHTFSEIQMDKLKSFDIIEPPQDADAFQKEEVFYKTKNMMGDTVKVTFTTYHTEMKPLFRVILDDGKRLIFTRRQMKQGGQHQAIFGDDPAQYGSVDKIPKCDHCKVMTGIKNVTYPVEFKSQTVILVGWQETISGKNTQAINIIMPDGTFELMGEWKNDSIHQKISPVIKK